MYLHIRIWPEKARAEAEMEEAPGTITAEDIAEPPAEEEAPAEKEAAGGEPYASGLTVPYEELKG